MSVVKIISKYAPRWRRCPANKWHRVTAENPECGHTGQILDWCEPWQRWVPNPTKTAEAKRMLAEDEEFEVDREARAKLEEALRNGDIKPAMDMRRRLLEQ